MTQFQTEVPDPLCHDLPALLPARGLATPAIRVLFNIFIGKDGFKGTAMQIQLHDIRSREALLGQASEKELIDDASSRDANPALLFTSGMGCHHHPAMDAFWPHWYLRTVVEAAHERAFRAMQKLVGGQAQTGLNQRMIQHGVVFATHYEEEASQIGEYGPGAILSIKAQEGMFLRELMRGEVATDGEERLTQFCSVEPIASVAKGAEPLRGVSLTDDGPGPHDFPSLASGVARGTELIQSSKGWGQFLCLRVCTERGQSGSSASEPGDHQSGHGQVNKSLTAGVRPLKIAREPTVVRDPGVGAFDDPSSGKDMEAFGDDRVPVDLCSFGCPDATQAGPSMFDDFQTDGKVFFDPLFAHDCLHTHYRPKSIGGEACFQQEAPVAPSPLRDLQCQQQALLP